MVWGACIDAFLFLAAVALFFMGYGIAALICAIVGAVVLLVLLGAKTNIFDDLADLVSDLINIFD